MDVVSRFLKYVSFDTASDEDNARAIPTAVRFVTSTYQSQMDAEAEQDAGEEAAAS